MALPHITWHLPSLFLSVQKLKCVWAVQMLFNSYTFTLHKLFCVTTSWQEKQYTDSGVRKFSSPRRNTVMSNKKYLSIMLNKNAFTKVASSFSTPLFLEDKYQYTTTQHLAALCQFVQLNVFCMRSRSTSRPIMNSVVLTCVCIAKSVCVYLGDGFWSLISTSSSKTNLWSATCAGTSGSTVVLVSAWVNSRTHFS